jgi:RNA polymerase sigma-70 factor (ECF subfamily)
VPVAEVTDSTSLTLLARAQSHDPEAWHRISAIYLPLVYRWARQAGLQECDAFDVVQEVFRTLAGQIGDFRRDRPGDSFRGWLWGITRNRLREFYRRRQAQPQAIGGTDAHDRLEALADQPPEDGDGQQRSGTQAAMMHRALELIRDEFEPTTWQAFWRTAVDQQDTAAVADELQMSPKAIRQAKFRVMRRLRLEVEKLL